MSYLKAADTISSTFVLQRIVRILAIAVKSLEQGLNIDTELRPLFF